MTVHMCSLTLFLRLFCLAALFAVGLSGVSWAQDEGVAPPVPAPDNPVPSPDQSVSFQTFYDALAGEGTWIQTTDYGYVWQPRIDDPNWAPYTNGHWVYTQDQWTWVSDEPWGWAVFHYGRWVNLDGVGWCWVPGYTWAPAWVSWRYGDGYCGWAPLPPDSLVGIDYQDGDVGDGFHIGGDCDDYYGIGPLWYNFLPVVYFGESDYRGHYADRRENRAIANQTTNVTNLNLSRNTSGTTGSSANFSTVTLGGPSLAQINAASRAPVTQASLAYTDRTGGGTLEGRSLALYAPQVNVGTVQSSRPASVGASFGNVAVNRGRDVTRPPVATSHFTASTSVTPSATAQPSVAGFGTPVANTQNRPAASSPYSSMRPMVFPSGTATTGSAAGFSGGGNYRSAPGAHYNVPPSSGGYHGATVTNPGFAPSTGGNHGATVTSPGFAPTTSGGGGQQRGH
jgi:hypothetical protein